MRSPFVTRLRTGGFYEHEDFGAVERMRHSIRGQEGAVQLDDQARTKTRLLPGTVFHNWFDTGLSVMRRQLGSGVRQAAFERIFGRPYAGDTMMFGEVATSRFPHDTRGSGTSSSIRFG